MTLLLQYLAFLHSIEHSIGGFIGQYVTPDQVNGAFEALASVMILNHTRALWKSRQAHGVSFLSSLFFTSWGFWNIWYYPHLEQLFSFYAGIAVVSANVFWNYSIWRIRQQGKS